MTVHPLFSEANFRNSFTTYCLQRRNSNPEPRYLQGSKEGTVGALGGGQMGYDGPAGAATPGFGYTLVPQEDADCAARPARLWAPPWEGGRAFLQTDQKAVK